MMNTTALVVSKCITKYWRLYSEGYDSPDFHPGIYAEPWHHGWGQYLEGENLPSQQGYEGIFHSEKLHFADFRDPEALRYERPNHLVIAARQPAMLLRPGPL